MIQILTNLSAEQATGLQVAQTYGTRWTVEQDLRDLKQTMQMDVLRCHSEQGVLKELTAYAIVHNLVRLVMGEAASRQGVEADRVSFIDALRWLLEAEPGAGLPKLVVNPIRPDRVEPRVRKRRPEQFPVMKKPRSELRKNLIKQEVAA